MDAEVRRLERRASQGGPEALLEWVRARRRAGAVAREPREGDRVRGEHLSALLVAGLEGRREVFVLRERGVPERGHSRLIDGLRGLARGEARPWSVVRDWARLLRLDPDDLAMMVEVVPARPPRPRPEPTPHPLTTLPDYPCCGRCRHMVWAVAVGAGVRCSNPASTVGQGALVPGLRLVCPAYDGPVFTVAPCFSASATGPSTTQESAESTGYSLPQGGNP